MGEPNKRRRFSLLRDKGENPAYRDKLLETIAEYKEFVDKLREDSLENIELYEVTINRSHKVELSESQKQFLNLLPDMNRYREVMNDFIHKHEAAMEEQQNQQKRVNLIPLNFL